MVNLLSGFHAKPPFYLTRNLSISHKYAYIIFVSLCFRLVISTWTIAIYDWVLRFGLVSRTKNLIMHGSMLKIKCRWRMFKGTQGSFRQNYYENSYKRMRLTPLFPRTHPSHRFVVLSIGYLFQRMKEGNENIWNIM